jgi:xanthine dehydrogenase accessory factor
MNQSNVFATAARLHETGTEYALVTVVRAEAPTSARPGDKAVVTADGTIHGWVGGGCAQPAVVKTVRLALADGHARLIRIAPTTDGERELGDVLEFGMACHSGGTLELFIDPVQPQPQLLIIGNSAVALALTQLAPRVGFAVQLAAHGAQASEFPDASQVFATDDAEQLSQQIGAGAYVVVATQGRRDLPGLRAALSVKARQISFVASERKAGVLKESLRAAGHDAAAVDAIVAPAGYPIAASTPEEIALSVLAALVAHRRGAVVSPAPHAVESDRATSGFAASSVSRPRAGAAAAIKDAGCCGTMAEAAAAAETVAVQPKSGRSCCGG